MVLRWLLALGVVLFAAGCQSSGTGSVGSSAAATGSSASSPPRTAAATTVSAKACGPATRQAAGGLTGRTITVRSLADIQLGDKEVVLTFDDGPARGKTQQVLATLDRYGVKATFFMVGQMVRANPQLVRAVAERGHTLGSHTDNHPNLTKRSMRAALEEIARGERAVATALSGSGHAAAPFFRFPYLAETQALRTAMAKRGTVVIGVDVDSKDYFRVSPRRVQDTTLKKLRRRGRGIVLFHDIHARTVAMLPGFLSALQKEGYKVVHLAPPGAVPQRCLTFS